VWNGNRNHNQVKLNDVAEQAAAEDSIVKARSLEEQLALLFVRILYSKEAVNLNEKILEASKVNENRGLEMYRVGSLSKAALSQLTSQRAQDEFNLVQSESNVRNYKRQLKALLQITDEEEFDVVATQATESMALQPIPSVQSVYEAAVENRPEIKRARLSIESADIQRRIASAQRLPTVTLNASATTNSSSQNNNAWGTQLKNGLNIGGGFSVNVPIFDRREARTAVNKANIQKQQALLDIRDKETTLYSSISDFWIQAYNNQQQYKSAKVSTESAQTSYDLLSEQFQVGLKNIVELQEGKTRLLNAQQSELQAKYTTIYCIKMLEFYKK
jgi:outer membrane protein